jgi:hypothetical protein
MDQRTKQNIKKAMELYFNNIGMQNYQGKPEFIMANLDGAWQYLLKLGLVKEEDYAQYIYAAEMQFKLYNMRGF